MKRTLKVALLTSTIIYALFLAWTILSYNAYVTAMIAKYEQRIPRDYIDLHSYMDYYGRPVLVGFALYVTLVGGIVCYNSKKTTVACFVFLVVMVLLSRPVLIWR